MNQLEREKLINTGRADFLCHNYRLKSRESTRQFKTTKILIQVSPYIHEQEIQLFFNFTRTLPLTGFLEIAAFPALALLQRPTVSVRGDRSYSPSSRVKIDFSCSLPTAYRYAPAAELFQWRVHLVS